jgi:NAD+ synthetase
VRLALCQLNTTVGAFVHNVDKIRDFVAKAAEAGAELVILPELCVSSYPPLDLLDRPGFIAANAEALRELAEKIAKLPNAPRAVVLGSIMPNPDSHGRAIQNATVVIEGGRVTQTQPKRLLPTYDVFDEARYFEPGHKCQLWDSPWGRIGLSVCEDAWFEDAHGGRAYYSVDPASELKGTDLVINVSASPFEMNKRARRQQLLAGFAKRAGAPLVYVNQVGANDEIIFDGGSLVYGKNGNVLFEMPFFREGIAVLEFDPGKEKVKELAAWQLEQGGKWDKMFVGDAARKNTDEAELLHGALVTGIKDYFRKTGFKKAVIGLSGGIDSAVVACLAAQALGPKNVLGVSLPSQYSSTHSLTDAEALAKNIGLEYRVLSIKFVFTSLLMEIKPAFLGAPPDATEENIQARLRAVMLMGLANKRNALLLTTGNKSELGVGYCTTYGDMAGAIAPLGDVYKTNVYRLARFINAKLGWIPESSITKAPSAELRPNQTDQDSLPPYDLLDRILELHFEGLAEEQELLAAGFDPQVVARVLKLVRTSEYKRRQGAPVLKVSSKAFGLGRRMPVAKAY